MGFSTTPPIGILCALAQELGVLKEALEDRDETGPWAVGRLDGQPVILSETGVGKVNAAISTTLMIERWRPRVVIVTGVAGGLSPLGAIGDVVIADTCIQHDAGVIEPGGFETYQAGHVPFFNPASELGYAADPAMIKRIRRRLSSLRLPAVRSGSNQEPRVEIGAILTGDQYLASESVRARLHERFRALAIEMEGASVAQTASRLAVPWLIVRALSDLAGNESSLDFSTFLDEVAANSALVVRHLLPIL